MSYVQNIKKYKKVKFTKWAWPNLVLQWQYPFTDDQPSSSKQHWSDCEVVSTGWMLLYNR